MGTDCKSAAFQLRWFESTRAHQTRKIRTCFRLEKGSDFSFSSGLRMKAPVDGVKLRYLVIDRKPITRFGGCDYEVRCKSLPFQHGHWMCGAAAPGWEKNLHRLHRGRGYAGHYCFLTGDVQHLLFGVARSILMESLYFYNFLYGSFIYSMLIFMHTDR